MSRNSLNEKMVELNKDRIGQMALDEDGDEIENSIVVSKRKIAVYEGNNIYISKFSGLTFEESITVLSLESLENLNKLVKGA